MLNVHNIIRTESTQVTLFNKSVQTTDLIIVMEHVKARARFHALNQRSHPLYGNFQIDNFGLHKEGFVGLHHATEDWYCSIAGWNIVLVENGIQIGLNEWRVEDGEIFDLETDWMNILPVIKWFLGLEPAEDTYLPN